MSGLDYPILSEFITKNVVEPFYAYRLEKLKAVKLATMLKNKNPYLFKAKNIQTAEQLVRQILDASISSGEETAFGDLLEQLSIHICGLVYGGQKSGIKGIDLEFNKDGIHYLVTIKSGPKWANSDQLDKMKINFRAAKRTFATSGGSLKVEVVNGCCYGKDNTPQKDEYLKLCGQRYWEFISGDSELYLELIKPLSQEAKKKDQDFEKEYVRKVNEMTKQMLDEFCDDGFIDWSKLVKFNSAKV